MKFHKLLSPLLLFSFVLAFGQDSQINNVSKLRGYEHSLRHGIMSKMNLSGHSEVDSLQTEQNLLQRNSDVQYEYIDIVKSSMNIPIAQCQDDNGNTYITGSSGNIANHSGDITTVKIDQNGTIVWTVRIPSSGFTVNSGTNISLDSSGNIILTGYIWNDGDMDIICVKINNEGEIVWQNTINNDLNFDIPTALFVNTNDEILITGVTYNNSTVTYYTAKLNIDGQLIWDYIDSEFPVSTWNEPKEVSQDSEGNVIVTGFGFENSNKSSIVTIKYASSGQLLWRNIRPYTAPLLDGTIVSTDAWSNDFVIDTENNIYITGVYRTEFANSTTTVKYDSTGTELWNFDFQEGDENTLAHKILMNQNVIYVGGLHYGSSQDGYLLLSLNLDGTINWIETTDDLNGIFKFNMFEHNNTIVLNSISYADMQFTNNKINTTSFTTTGSQINISNYIVNNEMLGLSFGNLFDSSIHNNTSIITFSSNYSDIGSVYETIKLDNNSGISNLIWSTKVQEVNATNTNVIETVSDINNNVYSLVSSFYVVNNQLNQKSHLIKFNEAGEIVWNKLLDDSPELVSLRVKVDLNNNLLVMLGSSSSNSSSEVTIKKIAPDGTDIWDESMLLDVSGNLLLEISNSNHIYIVGSAAGNANTTNIIVVKMAESGTLISTNFYQPNDEVYTINFVKKVIFDENDNLIIAGGSGIYNSALFQTVFSPSILKINSIGIMQYYNIFTISGHSSSVVDIILSDDILTLAVDCMDSISFYNKIKLMTLDQSGELIWQNTFEEPNSSNYVYDLLKGNGASFYTVGTRLGDSQNIQIIRWEVNQNTTSSTILDELNYYQDSYIDNQNIYVLSQNQESLHFPKRILNWIGPFISAKVTKFDYNLVQNEEINLIGENYSLYEPKQFIALDNNSLLISGRMFDEQLFFEGLYFFNIAYSPILNVPDHAENLSDGVFFNYPNPINFSETNLVFELQQNDFITLNLYDINGKFIKKILSGSYSQGVNNINVKLPILMNGVYILELANGYNHLQRKIVIKN